MFAVNRDVTHSVFDEFQKTGASTMPSTTSQYTNNFHINDVIITSFVTAIVRSA